jgi:hypothetical protein
MVHLTGRGISPNCGPGQIAQSAKEETTMSVQKSTIDFAYRPSSYFWPITHETHVIAAIKGERRRDIIRAAFDGNMVTPLDEHYATPVLQEEDRRALGRLHPSFMGGEYLPNRKDTEVEIARININSTTSDVTSVYAKAGKNRIYYRVVDEYNGDTLSEKRTRSSKHPLTLAELLAFFLGAWRLDEVIEMNELDREGAQDFTNPSSEFYPEFSAAIRAKIDEWCPAEESED